MHWTYSDNEVREPALSNRLRVQPKLLQHRARVVCHYHRRGAQQLNGTLLRALVGGQEDVATAVWVQAEELQRLLQAGRQAGRQADSRQAGR